MLKIKNLLVDLSINIFSYLYKNVKYKNTEEIIKVNLGCGLQCLPGWINIDGSLTSLFGSKKNIFVNKLLYHLAGSSNYYSFEAYNKVIQTCNLRFFNLKNGVPLLEGSADIIYCSHFLEHLSKKDSGIFLKGCNSVLKNGGLLRVVVPDLDIAMGMYQEGNVDKMQDLFFYTSSKWDMAAHKYNYNFDYLKKILLSSGFRDIKKMSYKKGECPEIDYLDVYPEHSLYVECRK